MEQKPKKLEIKRNIEQDRLAFLEAIKNTEISEINTEFNESDVSKLIASLNDTKLLILGETHGVKENVNIIYTLFKKFGFRQLALEWEPKLKDVVQKFLESGELDFDAIKESPDGRITAGHFALIKRLKTEGILERFICFDEGSRGEGWDECDINMAKNIIVNVSDAPTLAVAGNLHTETKPVTFDGSEHHPMGENIKKKIPNMPSAKIQYLAGQYHNYGTKDFVQEPKRVRLLKAKFYKSNDNTYLFELPEAHIAVVPNPGEVLPDEVGLEKIK